MEKIREYRIIEKLGEGGMGEVYLAEDENLGRQVAIKMLAPELMRNAELVERFKQEARLQASLIHPNIVALHTFFVEGGTFYMVMEYAKGETLSQRLKRVGLLPPYICIPIFNQILSAVGFAHEKGIIHRDLKPSNIIIDQNNNVKVMDFGIAKVLGDRGMTKTGTKMGTLNYMSPEQIMGEKDIDLRTDIFSLGITFYEMLTGKLPYETKTESDFMLMQQIVENKIPSVKESYPYVPDKVDTAIAIATQKSKGDRFNSCNEFKEYLNDEKDYKNNNTLNIKSDNNYSILETKTSENQEEYKDNKLYGVKGWLLYFVVNFTIFAPIGIIFTIIQEIKNWNYAIEEYPMYVGLIFFRILTNILLNVYSIYIGINLWKFRPNAVENAKKWIIIQFGLSTFINILSIIFLKKIYLELLTYGIFVNIISSSIMYLYFNNSKRVNITYFSKTQKNNLNNTNHKTYLINKEDRIKFIIAFVLGSIIFNGIYPQYFIIDTFRNMRLESRTLEIIIWCIVFWLPRLIGPSLVLFYFAKIKWEWVIGGILGGLIYGVSYLLQVNVSFYIQFFTFVSAIFVQGTLLFKKINNFYYLFILGIVYISVLNVINFSEFNFTYNWIIWQDIIVLSIYSFFQALVLLMFTKKTIK